MGPFLRGPQPLPDSWFAAARPRGFFRKIGLRVTTGLPIKKDRERAPGAAVAGETAVSRPAC